MGCDRTCSICHADMSGRRKHAVYCSDKCKNFGRNTLALLPPEMVEEAKLIETEDEFRSFFIQFMYPDGVLRATLLQSEMWKQYICDTLKYAVEHNNESKIADMVYVWLYDLKPNKCLQCGADTKFGNKEFRKYCSEPCYQLSIKKGNIGRKNIQSSIFNKYGTTTTRKVKSTKDKISKAFIERYGVDNPRKVEKFVEKGRETSISRYGFSHHLQNPTQYQKFMETMVERYGVKHALNLELFVEKSRQTMLDNYGVDNAMKIPGMYSKVSKNFGVVSKPEKEISEFLTQLGINHVMSNKTILAGFPYKDGGKTRELDIYCPDFKFAIEFNGCWWHTEKHKYRQYHLEKTEYCEQQGIHLFHVWSDDWRFRREVVLSKIMSKLGLLKPDCYARQCHIIETDLKSVKTFLENNHIQGSVQATHYLALRHSKTFEIKAVMLFTRRDKGSYELVRFASNGCHGAFSKLLKYFVKEYSDNIYSFGDRTSVCRFHNIYLANGFVEDSVGKPDYKYYNPKTDCREHKFKYRKTAFLSMGYDITNKTEYELAEEHGLVKIYDCGVIKYVLG